MKTIMDPNRLNFLKMVRAPFLSSIISPLFVGAFLALYITGRVVFLNFIFLFIK